MKIIEPPAVEEWSGILKGKDIQSYRKHFSDVSSYYLNAEGMDAETVMYDVYSSSSEEKADGSLEWGLTVLYPVSVNGECNMTKGHFHMDESCEEIYIGKAGEGLLMYMDHTGNTWCEKVFSGSVHHISGRYAHRLINTGDEPLKVMACWNSRAGHNYEAIQKQPFGYRVMKKDGKVEAVKNEQL